MLIKIQTIAQTMNTNLNKNRSYRLLKQNLVKLIK